MDAEQAVVVLTTLPADADPDELAAMLVGERLAACVSVMGEMQSIYRWRNEVERAGERQLIIKTTTACVHALETRLKGLHPYEVPEFLVLPVATGSAAYLAWLAESCRSDPAAE